MRSSSSGQIVGATNKIHGGSAMARVTVRATPPRVEVKIPVPAVLLGEVEAWVRLHPAHWRQTYPSRQVNNIYFDTADYQGLNANLAGIAERGKLRLRWYGPDLDRVTQGQLELKRRQGNSGWKEVVSLASDLDLVGGSWPALERRLGAAVADAAVDWFVRFPVPILINCYRRAYYATPDGVVRLTVDTRLKSWDQRASGRPNLSRCAMIDDLVVVELKAPVAPPSIRRLGAAVASLPARVDRFSKYVHGVMAAPDL